MSLYTLLGTSHQLRVGAANFATGTASGAYGTDALALGPWAYYRMGEAAGAGTMVDASGNGRNGSFIGTPLFGQAALVQDAGGDGAIRLDSIAVYGLAPEFTGSAFAFACHIRVPTIGTKHTIAAQDSGLPAGGWSFEIRDFSGVKRLVAYHRTAAGTGTAHFIGGTAGVNTAVGFGALSSDVTYTVGLYFGLGGAELWLDSTRVAHDTGYTAGLSSNSSQIALGSYHGGPGADALGFIDEVALFARVLSSGERATLSRPDNAIPPPVAQDDPVTGRHTVTAGTTQQFFPVLANDTGATDITSVSTPSPNIGTAVRDTGPPIRIGYTPPASVASATNVDISHTVSGPGGTASATLRLTVNPVAVVPPPVAQDDTFAAITEETGNHDFDVLANDTYNGTPTISIVSQTGPGTASVTGTGATSRIRVSTTGVDPGTKSVTYQLTNSAGAGSDQAVMTVPIQATPSGTWGTYVTGVGAFPRLTVPSKPLYRTAYYDPDFDCRIVRVGLTPGASVPNIGGTAPTWHRHSYSNKQMWNADESILGLWFLSSGSNGFSGFYFMDGHTYEMFPWGRRSVPSGGQRAADMFWHPKDRSRMIGIRNGNQLYFYRPETNATETITTFSGESGLVFTSTGSPSDAVGVTHPRVWLRRGTASGAAGFVYDIQTDTKFPVWTGSRADWSGMDHLGGHVYSHSSSSFAVHDVNGNFVADHPGPSKHADLVWNADRTAQYVVFNHSGDLVRVNFPSFTNQTNLVTVATPDHCSGRHIIAGNKFQGWVPAWSIDSSTAGVLQYEVFAVQLASPFTVRRLAHAYTYRGGGDNYPHEAHTSISPSGTRMIFASRWNITSGQVTADVQSYVIETFDYLNPVSGRILGI